MKTIIFDMYGVIIKESKGNFIPYTRNHFPPPEHDRLIKFLEKITFLQKQETAKLHRTNF